MTKVIKTKEKAVSKKSNIRISKQYHIKIN